MISRLICLFLLFYYSSTVASPEVRYTLSFPEPQTHYVKVRMDITGWDKQECVLKLPVWTPGSYMVREFSRHLEQLHAFAGGKELTVQRFRKNGWSVNTTGVKNVTVEYYIYAFELTVRTSFVDIDHAYLNGTSVFLYIDEMKQLPAVVEVQPYKEWKKISVALDRTNKNQWVFRADNYDKLVDAPMEIGNHQVFSFRASGVDHDVAIFGDGYFDSLTIKKDLVRIIESETAIFGENPCKNYLFIVHLIPVGSGGLEHENSTTIQANRNALTTPSGYNGFLSLAAHEYFHLWNVKRLRPVPLGPFDYDNENYTSLLYFSEGFTAYYDEKVTVTCGMVEPDNYLKTIAGAISSLENTPGNKLQSLAESGFDAWIKYYRPTENSTNSTVSYYSKGSLTGLMLDIMLIDATDGKYGLDDLMRKMYEEFYKKKNAGFTDADLIAATEALCSCSMKSFYDNYIYNVVPVPYQEVFAKAGVNVLSSLNENAAYAGFNSSFKEGKSVVTVVERNSPAWNAGINVNDEIVAVNGFRTDDVQKNITNAKPGDNWEITISRGGVLRTIKLILVSSPKVTYELKRDPDASAKQKRVFNKWLNAKV